MKEGIDMADLIRSEEFYLNEQRFKEKEIEILQSRLIRWKKITTFFCGASLFSMLLTVIGNIFYIAKLSSSFTTSLLAFHLSSGADIILGQENILFSADYMMMVIPVLLTLAGSFIALLGLDRLKTFDDKIEKLKVEMFSEISNQITIEIQKTRNAIIGEITSEIQTEKENLEIISSEYSQALKSEHQINSSELKQITTEFKEKFGWLQSTASNNAKTLNFDSVSDAHELVERLRVDKDSGRNEIIKKIVDRICIETDITGTEVDFHNFATEISRAELNGHACKVLKKGLSIFPNNTDLLADLVQFSKESGDFSIAEEAAASLEKLHKSLWTWRAYQFVFDYYISCGEIVGAKKISDEFFYALPHDEHAYMCQAKVAQLSIPGVNGINKSIQILESALNSNISCPQCANTLSKSKSDMGDFEGALIASNRAIRDLAEAQSSVNVSYVFFQRATVYEKLFFTDLEKGNNTQNLADNAYMDYKMALELGNLNFISNQQTEIRMKILKNHISPDLPSNDSKDLENFAEFLTSLATSNPDLFDTDD